MTGAPSGTTATPVATDVLALVQTTPPPLAEPEMLVEELRLLQQRIPGFTHLSLQEKRSRARAGNLDPEFIEAGLHAAGVWRDTEFIVHRSGEDLRREHEEIRRWEEVIVEFRAITAGIEAANLKRKHRLGWAILQIYRILGAWFRRYSRPEDAYMRPYYEKMKRIYLRTQQFRKRTKKDEPAAE